eukprot:gnl/TRDRNA2_/TRDRNA2_139359_c0_seq1.p1 gnl/TRDRNA2_/TRDRNA2_139359_c0~~gnl/TRDRNA2_/TRDRNA2_139359_c0_seq1.p1  ORF type:complete len:239 (+),score=56.29 gnl/TRDRNA2_/TRDRNA2_139359_c0_seq1:134-850(+)
MVGKRAELNDESDRLTERQKLEDVFLEDLLLFLDEQATLLQKNGSEDADLELLLHATATDKSFKSLYKDAPDISAEILICPPGLNAKHWGRVVVSHLEVSIEVNFAGNIGMKTMEPFQWKGVAADETLNTIEKPPPIGMNIHIKPPGFNDKHWGRVVAKRSTISLEVDFGAGLGLKKLDHSQWKDFAYSRDCPLLALRCSCGKIAAHCKKFKCKALFKLKTAKIIVEPIVPVKRSLTL